MGHGAGHLALCVHFKHACCIIKPESSGAFGLRCAMPQGDLEAGRGPWARPEEAVSTGACPQLPGPERATLVLLPRMSELSRSGVHGAAAEAAPPGGWSLQLTPAAAQVARRPCAGTRNRNRPRALRAAP